MHAGSCVVLSGVSWFVMRGTVMGAVDRRMYLGMIIMAWFVTTAYFLGFVYVVLTSSQSYNLIAILDAVLELLGSVSNTPLAFIFALIFNFVIMLGIHGLNILAFNMAELAKQVEWRRTGGRGQREVEMRV